MQKLTAQTFNQFIDQEVAVVEFFADWCGPCRQFAPILEKVSSDDVPVAKVDVDAQSHIAAIYGVTSIPTTIIFKDGVAERRFTGVKSYTDTLKFITEGE